MLERRLRIGLSAGCALLSLVVASEAAQARTPITTTAIEWGIGMQGGFVRTPSFTTNAVSSDLRDHVAGSVDGAGTVGVGGIYMGTGFVFGDRYRFPLLGLEVNHSVGKYAPVGASVDGSIAMMHPASMWAMTLLLSGFGMRWKHRRWLYEATLYPGVNILFMNVGLSSGASETTTTAAGISFQLRAEVAGCRRLDPTARLCLVAAPSIYERGFFSGGTLGLRWEGDVL